MTILCISDLHVPYHHPGAFEFLADLTRRHKPDTIVCLGDEVDAYAFSRFPKDPDQPGPGAELRAAAQALRPSCKLFLKVLVCELNPTCRSR